MTAAPPRDEPQWVFGYGSLLWNPGFATIERRPALLEGYRRAFCRYSFRHRGTPSEPGLVIGLHEGGACVGAAYRFDPAAQARSLAYLDEREGAGYHRLARPIALAATEAPRTVTAWVYVPNPQHPSYFGEHDPAHIAALVAKGRGESGTALDYLTRLVEELRALGTEEPELLDVLHRAQALQGDARRAG